MSSSQFSELVDGLSFITSQDYGKLQRLLEIAKQLAVSKRHTEHEILFGLHLEGMLGGRINDEFKKLYKALDAPSFNPFLKFMGDRSVGEIEYQGGPITDLVAVSDGLTHADDIKSVKIRGFTSIIFSRVITSLQKYQTLLEEFEEPESTQASSDRSDTGGQRILIGHGNSEVWEALRDYIEKELHLDHEEFNRVSTAGFPNTTRLEQMLGSSRFAFLVLTAEDEHIDGSMYPRGNVLHELGLAQGRYGFTKAIVLLEEDCAEISNIEGLSQIRFPKGNILAENPRAQIKMVLEREGITGAD